MCFIGVEVEQETSAPPPKKNPGSAPVVDGERIVATLRGSKARFSSLVSIHGVAYFVLSFL